MADPSAATDQAAHDYYARRAGHYANQARAIVAQIREYEEVHPDDAPCLQSLENAIYGIFWRGHAH